MAFSLSDQYLEVIARLNRDIAERNREVLWEFGSVVGDSVAPGGVLHTFGSGHSAMAETTVRILLSVGG
jgi:uncharacterized phosphosugar-binding protein